jgi:hypothetical protein
MQIKRNKAMNIIYTVIDVFNMIPAFLATLPTKLPYCKAKYGNFRQLRCSCHSIFTNPSICAAVATYVVEFGKKKFKEKHLTVLERFCYVTIFEKEKLLFVLTSSPIREYNISLLMKALWNFQWKSSTST